MWQKGLKGLTGMESEWNVCKTSTSETLCNFPITSTGEEKYFIPKNPFTKWRIGLMEGFIAIQLLKEKK